MIVFREKLAAEVSAQQAEEELSRQKEAETIARRMLTNQEEERQRKIMQKIKEIQQRETIENYKVDFSCFLHIFVLQLKFMVF